MPVLIPSREDAIGFAETLLRHIDAIRHYTSLCYRLCWSDWDDLRPPQSRVSPPHVSELVKAFAATSSLHHELKTAIEHPDFVLFCVSRKWRDAPPELYYNSAGVSPCESLGRTIRLLRRWPFFGAI